MSLIEKAIEEKICLDLFAKSYKTFPKGKIIKTESPDFIVKINQKKTIGIEITKLHHTDYKDLNRGYKMLEAMPHKIIDFLEQTISIKEDKLELYKKKMINSFWLIITVDLLKFDNFMINSIQNWQNKSQFNKVFLFELFNKNIFELV